MHEGQGREIGDDPVVGVCPFGVAHEFPVTLDTLVSLKFPDDRERGIESPVVDAEVVFFKHVGVKFPHFLRTDIAAYHALIAGRIGNLFQRIEICICHTGFNSEYFFIA